MNATNINCHIKAVETTSIIPDFVCSWYDAVIEENKNIKNKYHNVFAYLDNVWEHNK